jgi:16S rRNA (cytidine1402-2'-O)-methyltransferase
MGMEAAMSIKTKTGRLFLIPVPLSANGQLHQTLSQADIARVQTLEYFLVENAKTARAFLKTLPPSKPLQELHIEQIDKHKPDTGLEHLLSPLLAGHDMGLMSEAGCPAVADAGASAVAWAQAKTCQVVPLVGPSSLMLALMASGLNGQSFAFNGYLPSSSPERKLALRRLEERSSNEQQTQLAIETPYRTRAWFQDALSTLAPHTKLSLAIDVSLPTERCLTRSIAQWRASNDAQGAFLDHRLVVFSWLGAARR